MCELILPRRALSQSKSVRWYSNLGIVVFNSVFVGIVFPMLPVAFAVLSEERGWGMFNMISVMSGLDVIICLIILDLIIYIQHILFHKIPILWRFHRMHHADQDFDVSTGIRFHPVEIFLSIAIKMIAIFLIGVPAEAVLIFEVLLNATSLFNHANIKLPRSLDLVLRYFIVTPDMHRVHHSVIPKETNANFGFNLPWWDYLFLTYRAQPENGHKEMLIGISQFRTPNDLHLHRMLIQPFILGSEEKV
ncbi:MAG: sterol desaturase family protein [Pseudomonadota bacterium]|nr:sterol desaturase family protein [Pseudomonadota bacterium]